MDRDVFFDQVRRHFGFLIEKYGFSILKEEVGRSFDHRLVVLRSTDCSLRIARDRGTVLIQVGPSSAPVEGQPESPMRGWFDLGTIVAYLAPRPQHGEWHWFYSSPDATLDDDASTDWQLADLATKLQANLFPVCQLFREDTLRQKWEELGEFLERRKRESWRQVMRDD